MTNLLMLFYECNGIFVALLSSRGGIGRRARLRGVWEKSRDGSTPFVSTFRKPVSVLEQAFFTPYRQGVAIYCVFVSKKTRISS